MSLGCREHSQSNLECFPSHFRAKTHFEKKSCQKSLKKQQKKPKKWLFEVTNFILQSVKLANRPKWPSTNFSYPIVFPIFFVSNGQKFRKKFKISLLNVDWESFVSTLLFSKLVFLCVLDQTVCFQTCGGVPGGMSTRRSRIRGQTLPICSIRVEKLDRKNKK